MNENLLVLQPTDWTATIKKHTICNTIGPQW